MIKKTIQITIVDDRRSNECEAQCGLDWSSPETIALASQRINDKFGSRVKLEYINLTQPTSDRHRLELKQEVRDGNLALPLLMINGQPRISGQFDIRMLLDVIEAETEIEV